MTDSSQGSINGSTPQVNTSDSNQNMSNEPQVTNSADSYSTKLPPSYFSKQFVSGKSLSSLFGMVLLVGSMAAGVILVTQPQLLGQKAAGEGPQKCNPKSVCVFKQIPGSTLCIPSSEGEPNYCCPLDYKIIDGVCLSK